MRMRRPRFFTLIVIISLLLCVVFGGMWIASRSIRTAAWPSTYNVQAQLARPLPQVNFQNVTIKDALEFLRDISGQKIEVDWAALEAGGILPDNVVTKSVRNIKQ